MKRSKINVAQAAEMFRKLTMDRPDSWLNPHGRPQCVD
jgi:hypothetical protein